ncbi:MAG: sigma-54 dependent transcriptional regulator [Bacteroidales bacterium]
MELNKNLSPEILQVKQRFSIIGNAATLMNAIGRAMQVAPIDLSVLITGESGAGKEFFPKIIHNNSSRKHSKYIAVNCGAIPEGTIDSELFGHEKGAFTGAISSRKGYFEEANGGTIFLDEVAELPLTTQARLLRVLESGEFIKVGSSEVQKTNIRVVAATNMNMVKAVAEGSFREDLFYRLSTVHIEVPPLRDRDNDIVMLTRKFSSDFAEKYKTPIIEFSMGAKNMLLKYRWPGNVRQLKNIIEQIALFEAGKMIDEQLLSGYLPKSDAEYKPAVISEPTFDYNREREMLFKMLFSMRKELEELREEIAEINSGGVSTAIKKKFDYIDEEDEGSSIEPTISHINSLVKFSDYNDIDISASEFKDISSVEGQSSMTLEDTERMTIINALERNGGKRKKTAVELQISERTLYRKIKEYGLE